jgi:uncharacterized protein YndB with AHSA1/START domain
MSLKNQQESKPGNSGEVSVDNSTMSISRELNAPVALVYKVWTDPEHIKHWWGPEGFTSTISKMEVNSGGEWNLMMHGPDGTDYRNESRYTEVVPNQRLVYEHLTGPKFTATIIFEAVGDKTLLTMKMVFDTADLLQKTIKEFNAAVGMRQNMERLQGYLGNLK